MEKEVADNRSDDIHLARPYSEVAGKDLHRHGWPWVVKQLRQLENPELSENTLLFDEYTEKTFERYPGKKLPVYNRPWVGIFHEPPDIPDWLQNYPHKLDTLLTVPEFRRSLPNLRCAFVLSEFAANALRKKLTSCPVHVLHHPVPRPPLSWSPENFRKNRKAALMQFGFYMRNTHIVLQVPPCALLRVRYFPTDIDWINHWDKLVAEYWSQRGSRRHYKGRRACRSWPTRHMTGPWQAMC